MSATVLCMAFSLGTAPIAVPSNCRLYIASQYDWEKKTGFYLDLEGAALKELPVILGAGNGSNWRFISHCPPFVPDKTYQIRGVVSPQGTQLLVNGAKVAESEGSWTPATGSLEINYRPSWANEPGDWVTSVDRVTLSVLRDGSEVQKGDFDFTKAGRVSPALQLFEPGLLTVSDLEGEPGDTVIVDVVLRFVLSDPRRWAPMIDRYGQAVHAEFPEKVRSDEDLRGDLARENAELAQMPPSRDFDEYGGYTKAGWSEKATGFFYLVQREGYWWLITPEGNPCFYLGVCSVPGSTWETTPVTDREFLYEWLPPREAPWSAAWAKNCWGTSDGTEYVCFYTCNLIRKYGPEAWDERITEQALRRLKAWGFSGGGKWGGPASVVTTPVLHRWGTPNLDRHPDVFDPEVCAKFREDLRQQIEPRRNDPRVLGWSLGNEYDEIITPDEVRKILAKPAQTPGKRALIDHAVNERYGGAVARLAEAWKLAAVDQEALYAAAPEPPDEDVEALRRFYAHSYYAFVYRTVKQIDPNHLYLGFWIVPGWWVNEEDWRLIAPHCDAIGYDRYSPNFEDERLVRLKAESGKAVICGEFSYPAWYGGQRGFGRYSTWAKDDADAGRLYGRWMRDAARDPYCIGSIWFLMRDQPLTGRGPGRGDRLVYGEHFAFGLVTETDRPKWALVRQVREANLRLPQWRIEASKAPK